MPEVNSAVRAALVLALVVLQGACGEGPGDDGNTLVRVVGPLASGTRTLARPEVGFLTTPVGGQAVALCTGTLITVRYVLTAAHCLGYWAPDAGPITFTIQHADETASTFNVTRAVAINWSPPGGAFRTWNANYEADVAVLELQTGVPASEATPVAIADGLPTNYDRSTRIGYGGDPNVKRSRSFTGPFSSFAERGDSGGPVLFGSDVNIAGPVWGVVSKHTDRDVDADVSYFKLQIEGIIRAWTGDRQYDIDRPGGDYSVFAVTSPGDPAGWCQYWCEVDSEHCVAWSVSAEGMCHLKEALGSWLPSAGWRSGISKVRDGSGRRTLVGWDRPGHNYASAITTGHAACADLCAKDERCRALASSRRSDGRTDCWLKDAPTQPVRDPQFRSEVRRGLDMNTDRIGHVYRFWDEGIHAPEHCQSDCARDARCRSWAYATAENTAIYSTCLLQDDVPAPAPAPGMISGRRDRIFQ